MYMVYNAGCWPATGVSLYGRSSGRVMKCWNCGSLYNFYAHMVGDQSVCPKCRREADANK